MNEKNHSQETQYRETLETVLAQHRARLKRLVALRIDRRLAGRIDASDVIQDAFLQATKRFAEYKQKPAVSEFIWLRQLVMQNLVDCHRTHLGAQKRSAHREVSLFSQPVPDASTALLAAHLVGSLTTPSQAAIKAERTRQLQEALNDLDPLDREIIALRHFEQLTRSETASALKISESTASRRYISAISRLQESLSDE